MAADVWDQIKDIADKEYDGDVERASRDLHSIEDEVNGSIRVSRGEYALNLNTGRREYTVGGLSSIHEVRETVDSMAQLEKVFQADRGNYKAISRYLDSQQ